MTFKSLRENILSELQRNTFDKDVSREFKYPMSDEYHLFKNFEKEVTFPLSERESIIVKYRIQGGEIEVIPWILLDGKVPLPTGFLTLKKRKFGKFVFFYEDYSILKDQYHGRGIMFLVYKGLAEAGINLVANGSHSIGAAKLWQKLSKDSNLTLWAVFGDTFIEDEEDEKKDYIYAIQLSKTLRTKSNTKELTKAIFKSPEGKISSRSVYNDYDPDNKTSFVLTKKGGMLDVAFDKLDKFGAEDLPFKETDDTEIKTLYQAINSILLNK